MNVYVVAGSESGPCKIGVAKNPTRRLRELQTASPMTLSIFHSEPVGILANAVEKAAHDSLRDKRTQADNEWFYVSSVEAIVAIKTAAANICSLSNETEKSVRDIQFEITKKWLRQKTAFEEKQDFDEEFSVRCPDLLKSIAETTSAPALARFTFNHYILTWDEGPWLRWAFGRMTKKIPIGKAIAPYLRADDYLESIDAKYGRDVTLRWIEWSQARALHEHEIRELVAVWNTYSLAYNAVFEGPEHDVHGKSDHVDDVYVYALLGDRAKKDRDKIVLYHDDFRVVLVPDRHIDLVDFKKSAFGRLKQLPDIQIHGFVAPPVPTDIWERPLRPWLQDCGKRQENSLFSFIGNRNRRYPKIERHDLPRAASRAWQQLPCVGEDGEF